MAKCSQCDAGIEDPTAEVCWFCGAAIKPEAAAVAVMPPPVAAPAPPAPAVRSPESTRSLESKLSALMDDKDVPDWKVNPAFHPDVAAFIREHSGNTEFVKRADALQKNRASYYSTMRARAVTASTPAPAVEPVAVAAPVVAPIAVPATAETKSRPKRRWVRRVALAVAAAVLLAVGVPLSASLYYRAAGPSQLEAVNQVLDQKDADWRQADRVGRGVALPVVEAADKLPVDWPNQPELAAALENWSIELAAKPENREALRTVTDQAAAALTVLRTPNAAASAATTAAATTRMQQALWLTAVRAAGDGKPDAAVAALGDLMAVTQSARPVDSLTAKRPGGDVRPVSTALAYVLNQASPSEADCKTLQTQFSAEADRPWAQDVLRGYRARVDRIFSAVEGGDCPADEASEVADINRSLIRAGPPCNTERWFQAGWVRANHATALVVLTRAVAGTCGCDDDEHRAFALCETTLRDMAANPLDRPARSALAGIEDLHRKAAEREALLRCGETALALRRYQAAKGSWPETLQALVPDYLTAVPVDPTSSKPLVYQRDGNGAHVFANGDKAETIRIDLHR